MSRRCLVSLASVLLLACGDDSSPMGSAGSSSSDGSESTGPVDPDDTSAGATSIPGDTSSEGTSTTALDSSTGPAAECGNGVLDADEACDGDALDEAACTTFGFMSGRLACLDDCSGFDTSQCVEYPARCGDEVAEDDEACDGTDLLDQSCATQGFDSGTLTCTPECTFDTSACGTCGNVILDGDEACDGVALLGETCVSQGFAYGEIACAADCMGFDTTGCGLCGDGSVGGEELCDGADLGGATCMSTGFGAGNLACLPDCTFDFAGCEGPDFEVVDFPIASDPRFNLSGNLPWNAGDWYEGVRMTGIPSTNQVDIHLEIVSNLLSPCGVQEAEVSINGVALGTFAVVQGTTVIDQSFPVMPAIAGPVYTIRYETTATVAAGCGSAGYDEIGSTVTFYPG